MKMRTRIYTAFGHRFYDLSAFVRVRPRPIYGTDAMSGCAPITNVNGTLISLILADFFSYPRSSAFVRVLFTKQIP